MVPIKTIEGRLYEISSHIMEIQESSQRNVEKLVDVVIEKASISSFLKFCRVAYEHDRVIWAQILNKNKENGRL